MSEGSSLVAIAFTLVFLKFLLKVIYGDSWQVDIQICAMTTQLTIDIFNSKSGLKQKCFDETEKLKK